jgi:hypothetical protein
MGIPTSIASINLPAGGPLAVDCESVATSDEMLVA